VALEIDVDIFKAVLLSLVAVETTNASAKKKQKVEESLEMKKLVKKKVPKKRSCEQV
jgi:hypothetical protein